MSAKIRAKLPAAAGGTTEDYQWPPQRPPKSFRRAKLPARRTAALTREIEEFFEQRLGVHAVLLPSGRAGFTMAFRAHGIDRSRVVFSPQWVSYCVWTVIGRYGNPTISLDIEPDVLIAVHKWAEVARFSKPYRGLIIEDSVDTTFDNTNSLFPTGGLYEVLSLPKILASFSGGIVLTRDAGAAARFRDMRSEGDGLAEHQSYLKYLMSRKIRTEANRFEDWFSTEYANTQLDSNGLLNVKDCLKNYDLNAAVMRRRLREVMAERPRFAAYFDVSTGRLPSVLSLPCDDFEPVPDPSQWMLRRKLVGGLLDKPDYRLAYLLPLHGGVDERRFRRMFESLRLRPGRGL